MNFEQILNALMTGEYDKYLHVAAIIIGIWLIKRITLHILNKNIKDMKIKYRWRKIINYISVVLGILLIAQLWFKGIESIVTFLGLISAGIAIALKDIWSSIAGWLFIIIRQPFTVGDRIEIQNMKGDVIDVGVFHFTILEIENWVKAEQSTGRMINIPNGLVLSNPVANYSSTFEFIWNEIEIVLTFESNWEKAKEILTTIINDYVEDKLEEARKEMSKASEEYLIYSSKLTPIIYTDVVDIGVRLSIRYFSRPKERRNSGQYIWETVLREFAKRDDIDFAYPTYRYYNNITEGKKNAKADNSEFIFQFKTADQIKKDLLNQLKKDEQNIDEELKIINENIMKNDEDDSESSD